MMDNLSAFLAIWSQYISKFSPTMVDKFKCISSHLRSAYFKIFSNHGGQSNDSQVAILLLLLTIYYNFISVQQ